MKTQKSIAVYYAMPLCRKCRDEVAKIRNVAATGPAEMSVRFSIWQRIKYGLQLMTMPVVVVDNKPFSVLGAFGEEALAAELRNHNVI